MRHLIFLLLASLVLSKNSYAQSVAINTNGAAANTSSILDITSTTKGLLIPRMTTVQRTAIATPAKGLIVFDITTNGLWVHNGTAWNALSSGSSTNYWSVNGSDIYNNTAGNVGIGTNSPSAYGHGGNNRVMEISNLNTGTNSQSHLILSSNGTSGSVGSISWASQNVPGIEKKLAIIGDVYETANAARMVFYTRDETGFLGERMTVMGNGYLGIGTTTPADKFTVQTLSNNFGISHTDGTITVGTYVGLGDGWLGTKSNHPLALFTNNSLPQLLIATNGNVGIGLGIGTPLAKLHIAGNVKIDGNNSIEMGAGVAGKEANAGKIGYETFTPGTLDIVGAGTTGTNRKIKFWNEGGANFNGNIGISNGNVAISNGRVGINTVTPRAPLDVTSYTFYAGLAFAYLNVNSLGGENVGSTSSSPINVSIYADESVFARQFAAFSDERIKNITGISNSKKDLETIKALQITDYTMKDKIKNGNKTFKKVIAQQVEKEYPQVVNKHTDFIPNVYQASSKVEKIATGYLISFNSKHNISPTAKRLRVILSEAEGMKEMDIVLIPSETQVIINVPNIKSDKVFVYGEEVDDFRTVDYEGLTTLNISATQELSKLIKKQQAIIEIQQQQIEQLLKRMETVEKNNPLITTDYLSVKK